MRLIIVGCEYSGKTTLSEEIIAWTNNQLGGGRSFHDHFTIPNPELSKEAMDEFIKSHPQIKEMYQRFMMAHHLSPEFYKAPDHNIVGFHIEEAVYAPLYYGYGGKNSGALERAPEGQRSYWARVLDKEILDIAPDTVLILMKADAEVIKTRMDENPHEYQVVQKEDIEYVLERFEEEYANSLIHRRFILDTSHASISDTLAEFQEKIEPLLTDQDRSRMLAHSNLWSK